MILTAFFHRDICLVHQKPARNYSFPISRVCRRAYEERARTSHILELRPVASQKRKAALLKVFESEADMQGVLAALQRSTSTTNVSRVQPWWPGDVGVISVP